jgi:endonuclease/exonuclease/phosphatase family metal-dependent hydrolase
MSAHHAFNSPRGREREVDETTAFVDRMARQGGGFIVGGDFNEGAASARRERLSHPVGDRHRQLCHLTHRTNLAPDGSRVSCTYVDRTLLTCGLQDAARYAAHTLGQPAAIGPTAGHAKPGQGGPRRIDRIYVDGRIARAILSVEVVDTTGVSDHFGLRVVLSERGLGEAQRREHQPVPLDRAVALLMPSRSGATA